MLSKKHRLPVGSFPAGAKTVYRGSRLALKTSPNNLSYNRVGVIITKKTAPKAVERNYLRRRIFDMFQKEARLRFAEARKSEGELRKSSGEGTDLLVIVKPIKLDRDAREKLLEELNSALGKIRKKPTK